MLLILCCVTNCPKLRTTNIYYPTVSVRQESELLSPDGWGQGLPKEVSVRLQSHLMDQRENLPPGSLAGLLVTFRCHSLRGGGSVPCWLGPEAPSAPRQQLSLRVSEQERESPGRPRLRSGLASLQLVRSKSVNPAHTQGERENPTKK